MLSSTKRPQTLIGIDIGSTLIKMVEVRQGEKPSLMKWASVPNPNDGVSYTRLSDKKIAKALKECWKQLNSTCKVASLCLNDPSLIVKEMTFPIMEDKELLENIRFGLAEFYASDLSQYNISYKLGKVNSDTNDMVSVTIAAAPFSRLNETVNIVKSSGLNLQYIDVSANAISKLLKCMKRETEQEDDGLKTIMCVVDLSSKAIEIAVYENDSFLVDKSNTIKDPNDFDEILTPLNQVLDYYERRNYDLNVSKVILTGGRAYQEGITEYISAQTGIPAETARPDMFVSVTNLSIEFPVALYFKALGAAIRED